MALNKPEPGTMEVLLKGGPANGVSVWVAGPPLPSFIEVPSTVSKLEIEAHNRHCNVWFKGDRCTCGLGCSPYSKKVAVSYYNRDDSGVFYYMQDVGGQHV